MKDLVYVSSNTHKVAALNKWLGRTLPHRGLDIEELQDLDPQKVIEHKARSAYIQIGGPILIEDTSLTFHALGNLPGTYIKWFLQELGTEGLCKILDGYTDRSATGLVHYALYDGSKMYFFKCKVFGSVPKQPRGNRGFGWNPVFVPNGINKTYAELSDTEFAKYGARPAAVAKLKTFLDNLEA